MVLNDAVWVSMVIRLDKSMRSRVLLVINARSIGTADSRPSM